MGAEVEYCDEENCGCVCFFAVSCNPAFAHDGYFWNSISLDEKETYIMGYCAGYEHGAQVAALMSGPSPQLKSFKELMRSTSLEWWVDQVHEFYMLDEKYYPIPILAMMTVAREVREGDITSLEEVVRRLDTALPIYTK